MSRITLLLCFYSTDTSSHQEKNKIEVNYMRNNAWVEANHQTSASEKLQTPPVQSCLGDRAQDVLKELLGSTSPDSFAKPGEQQLHCLSKPEPSNSSKSRQCEAVTERTLLLPAAWAAAELQVESCGGGKGETGELPD